MLFGDDESRHKVFERACAQTDSLRVHKQLAKALKSNHLDEEATELFERMLRKFRHRGDLEVWSLYAEHLLEMKETERERELLRRALQSMDKKQRRKQFNLQLDALLVLIG